MQNKFLEYRNEYKEFIYHGYDIEEDNNKIIITYNFEIPNLSKFSPRTEINKKDIKFNSIDDDFLKYIVFNLGMVELISYWKCVCPKKVIVECGYLNNEQIQWYKKLYYNGLGEYRYINNIDVEMQDMLDIEICLKKQEIKQKVNTLNNKGYLIPVGGGKDSIVTLELLKDYVSDSYCITIGGKEPSINSAKAAGYSNSQIIEVNRIIDNNIKELNAKGYLNGHTPFSMMLAFLSYMIAYMTNKKYIPLSNESSANESNVEGQKINHQYSKSFEAEQDFREYVTKYLNPDIQYFSFLRPISELQIAMLFSRNEKYHKIFRSCNVGSKKMPWEWCCNCPKCLFVYCILSPFLYKEKLVNIFGEDLFEKKDLLNTFIELCGYGKTKPFECVGTYDEVKFAITKTIENLQSENKKLPYLLDYYKNNYNLVDTSIDITKTYNEENNLPKNLEEVLKKEILKDD